MFSCKESKASKQTTLSEEEVRRIMGKLPYKNPDACIKMIVDSAKSSEDMRNMSYYAMCFGFSRNPDTYFELLEKIDSLVGRDNDTIRFYILGFKGENYTKIGKYEEGLASLKESLLLAQMIGDSTSISDAFQLMNTYYMQRRNYAQSLTYIHKSIEYLPKKARLTRAQIIMELSRNYHAQKNYEKAKEYTLQALSFLDSSNFKHKARISLYLGDLSRNYANLEQGDSALWAAQKAYRQAKENADTTKIANIYFAMGVAYKLKGNYANAIHYLEVAQKMAKEYSLSMTEHEINSTMASIYMLIGKLDIAENIYLSILNDEKIRGKTPLSAKICDSLVVLNLQKMGKKNWLNTFRQSRHFVDSSFSTERLHIMEDLSIQYDVKEKENQIKELDFAKKGFQIQALVATLILIIVFLIGGWIMHRNKQKQLLLKQENELLTYKKQLQEQEILSNKQQIGDLKDYFIAKNKLITEMEQRILLLMANETTVEHNKLGIEKKRFMEMKILTEKDWQTYLIYIEDNYPELIKRINTEYPTLTQGELRLFLLMNMNFKKHEIADILGISKDGVRKSQYRLRMRLGLEEKSDLEDFIAHFNQT